MVPRKPGRKHPWENRSYWNKQLRVFILQRDILCRICQRKGSTVVDHIVPFIAPDGSVSWALFSDPANLRGLCAECHNKVTATFDRGFGNAPKAGKENFRPLKDGEFQSSAVEASDESLFVGLDELLKDL